MHNYKFPFECFESFLSRQMLRPKENYLFVIKSTFPAKIIIIFAVGKGNVLNTYIKQFFAKSEFLHHFPT